MYARDLARKILNPEFRKIKCVIEIMDKKKIIITIDLMPRMIIMFFVFLCFAVVALWVKTQKGGRAA